jgi:phosphoribosylformimino-5-aminoimidazole carboxamide ribotide isomerase
LVVIPAIDIKEGRCVRLKQGRMTDETVFSEVPEEMAVKWFKLGAERLHIIDLDGAAQGRPVNNLTIKRIVDSVPIPIELGGGVRDMDSMETYFDIGIHYVIVGTVAYKDPEFVMRACERFPGRIILGIDARNERVAVEGWTEEIDSRPVEMAEKFKASGVSSIIYTDIHRDGMRTGPNVDSTRDLARAIQIPVIASGGISGISDVIEILKLSEDGVIGMITGMALYDGSLDLSEAIEVCREQR